MIPGAALTIGMYFQPLAALAGRAGRDDEAREVLGHARETDEEVEEELKEIEEEASSKGSLRDRAGVRAMVVIGGDGDFPQLIGVNTVIYYAPTILKSTGLSAPRSAITQAFSVGITNVIFTIVAISSSTRPGRRCC